MATKKKTIYTPPANNNRYSIYDYNYSYFPNRTNAQLNANNPSTSSNQDEYVKHNYEVGLEYPMIRHNPGYGAHLTDFEKMLYAKGQLGASYGSIRTPNYGQNNNVINYGTFANPDRGDFSSYGESEIGLTGKFLPRTTTPITLRKSQAGVGVGFGTNMNVNKTYLGPRVHIHPEIGYQPTYVVGNGIRREQHTSPLYLYANADYVKNANILNHEMGQQDFRNLNRDRFTVGAGFNYEIPTKQYDYPVNPYVRGEVDYNFYTKQPQYQIGVGLNNFKKGGPVKKYYSEIEPGSKLTTVFDLNSSTVPSNFNDTNASELANQNGNPNEFVFGATTNVTNSRQALNVAAPIGGNYTPKNHLFVTGSPGVEQGMRRRAYQERDPRGVLVAKMSNWEPYVRPEIEGGVMFTKKYDPYVDRTSGFTTKNSSYEAGLGYYGGSFAPYVKLNPTLTYRMRPDSWQPEPPQKVDESDFYVARYMREHPGYDTVSKFKPVGLDISGGLDIRSTVPMGGDEATLYDYNRMGNAWNTGAQRLGANIGAKLLTASGINPYIKLGANYNPELTQKFVPSATIGVNSVITNKGNKRRYIPVQHKDGGPTMTFNTMPVGTVGAPPAADNTVTHVAPVITKEEKNKKALKRLQKTTEEHVDFIRDDKGNVVKDAQGNPVYTPAKGTTYGDNGTIVAGALLAGPALKAAGALMETALPVVGNVGNALTYAMVPQAAWNAAQGDYTDAALLATPYLFKGLKATPSVLKNAKQELIYNAIDPIGYNVVEKLKNTPRTLYNNITGTPIERSLKTGYMLHDPITHGNLTNEELIALGNNRLDAWRVGLGLPQKNKTFKKIGPNTYTINNSDFTTRDFDKIIETIKNPKGESVGYSEGNSSEGIVEKAKDPNFQWSVYDRDSQNGIMGGYRWDVAETPEGRYLLKYKDTWDLHPWAKRGNIVNRQLNNIKKDPFKPFKNIEALDLLGGKPYDIEGEFLYDPVNKKIIPTLTKNYFPFLSQYKEGGWLDTYDNGGMIKRADGHYSRRGLWDNIRANKGSGRKPTKEMLKQEAKIKKQYGDGGPHIQKVAIQPEDIHLNLPNTAHHQISPLGLNTFLVNDKKQGIVIGGINPRIQTEDFSVGPYARMVGNRQFQVPMYGVAGTYHLNNDIDLSGEVGSNGFGAGLNYRFGNGGEVTFSAGGEKHRVYKKESPTGNGKGVEGHIMVTHPTMDKGKWDTIDLTEIAGAKTVAQGVAATKEWHEENPNEYANGGYVVKRSNARKGKTHVVIGPDGTKKYFGDSKLGQHPKDPARKKAFYARHKHNLEKNPYFRAFARKTWKDGGELDMYENGGKSDYNMLGYAVHHPVGALKHMINPEKYHATDEYKRPNHMTFSDESKYSNNEHPGGHWSQTPDGKWTFTPTDFNIENAGGPERYQQWWDQTEGRDGNLLILPKRENGGNIKTKVSHKDMLNEIINFGNQNRYKKW